MLKLEHLSPYLPYKLNILREGKIVELCGLNKPYKTNDNFYIRGETKVINGTYKSTLSFMVDSKSSINFKPILRQMSDLTKEIDGRIFLIELLTLLEKNHFSKDQVVKNCSVNFKPNVIECESKTYSQSVEHTVRYAMKTGNMGTLIYVFTYSERFNRFSKRDETRDITMGTGYQLECFQFLFKNHFDVFGLIDQGLAVSIHDIPKTEK